MPLVQDRDFECNTQICWGVGRDHHNLFKGLQRVLNRLGSLNGLPKLDIDGFIGSDTTGRWNRLVPGCLAQLVRLGGEPPVGLFRSMTKTELARNADVALDWLNVVAESLASTHNTNISGTTMEDLHKALFQQDSKFASIVDRANQVHYPTAGEMQKFLDSRKFGKDRGWNGVFTTWALGNPSWDEVLRRMNEEIYPAAREAGFPDFAMVLPDISVSGYDWPDTQAEQDATIPPTPVLASAELDQFAGNFCVVKVVGDELVAQCHWNGAVHERRCDLIPIIEWVKSRLDAWHHSAYVGDPQVSGMWGDLYHLAVDPAIAVARNKLVRELVTDVGPEFVPGGKVTTTVIQKSIETVTDAKKGDPGAKVKVKKLRAMADAGDPKAKTVVKQMQQTSKALDEKGTMTSFYDRGVQVGHSPVEIGSAWLNIGTPVDFVGAGFGKGVNLPTPMNRPKSRTPNVVYPTPPGVQPGMPTPGVVPPGYPPMPPGYPPPGYGGYPPPGYGGYPMPDPYGGMGMGYPPMPQGYGGYPPVDPYGGMGMGYPPMDPYALAAMYGYGTDDPQNITNRVYDPATDSFYSNEIPQEYDPDTDSFHPKLSANPYNPLSMPGGF